MRWILLIFLLCADIACAHKTVFSVQIRDKDLGTDNIQKYISFAHEAGFEFVRVDMNWPDTDFGAGQDFFWGKYDELSNLLKKYSIRPIFILNRPNLKWLTDLDKNRSPSSLVSIDAFSNWAAAASARYANLNPIWEIWNEPDQSMFWGGDPDPIAYAKLATATCRKIKNINASYIVVAPGIAQMPIFWGRRSETLHALYRNFELMNCLDGISIHAHRFGQNPETILRDLTAFDKDYVLFNGGRERPKLYVTEWGDSTYRKGVSEDKQALWLARVLLMSVFNNFELINWYCLKDVGSAPDEREDNFGLLRFDWTEKKSYTVARRLIGLLKNKDISIVHDGFDVAAAQGVAAISACSNDGYCNLIAWATERTNKRLIINLKKFYFFEGGVDFFGNQIAINKDNLDYFLSADFLRNGLVLRFRWKE